MYLNSIRLVPDVYSYSLLLGYCLCIQTIDSNFDPNMDSYKLLGVSETCSDDELKKTYRVLLLRYHPDKAGPDSKTPCQDIIRAYEHIRSSRHRKTQIRETCNPFPEDDVAHASWFAEMLTKLDTEIQELGARLDAHESKLAEYGRMLEEFGRRLEDIGRRLEDIGRRLDKIEQVIQDIESNLGSMPKDKQLFVHICRDVSYSGESVDLVTRFRLKALVEEDEEAGDDGS